jgi:hypothetical protein
VSRRPAGPVTPWQRWPGVAVARTGAEPLFTAGYNLAGAAACVLCPGAYAARKRAMRG